MRLRSQPGYWFGTQAAIEAGTAFAGGEEVVFHQPKFRLHV